MRNIGKRGLVWLLLTAMSIGTCAATEFRIQLKNQLNLQRLEEPVVLQRAAFAQLFKTFRDPDQIQVFRGQQQVFLQTDDLNGDGQWDEIFMLIDFQPLENVLIRVTYGLPAKPYVVVPRTNIWLGGKDSTQKAAHFHELTEAKRMAGTSGQQTRMHFQYEGPGWENDKVAFRNYFDQRNQMDIFGKITPDMVLQKVGVDGNYHQLREWGMDILAVERSLGAGSIAWLYADTLAFVTSPSGASFKVITKGPLRSVFQLTFPEAQIGPHTLALTHTISMVAGKYGYLSTVTLPRLPARVKLAAGFARLKSDSLHQVTTAQAHGIFSFARQAYGGEFLGMGLLTTKASFLKAMNVPTRPKGVADTYAMVYEQGNHSSVSFAFIAGWERSHSQFATYEGFKDYFTQEVQKYGSPIVAEVISR